MKSVLWICFCACLAVAARCHDVRQVFVHHAIYFNEPGGYARLIRVQGLESALAGTPSLPAFENAPVVAESVPLDFLVLGLKKAIGAVLQGLDPNHLSALRGQELDLAGALIAPLLAFLTCLFLGFWARNAAPSRWSAAALPFLFAVSPLVAHGALLGAPNNVALLMAALAVGLASESRPASLLSRPWMISGGAAWALALWISWQESLVLLGAVVLMRLAFHPRRLLCPERWPWLLAFCVLGGCAIVAQCGAVADSVVNLSSIGRGIRSEEASGIGGVLGWVGAGLLASPVLLLVAGRHDRRALAGLLLLVLVGVAVYGLGWGGYWIEIGCLLFLMSLPWMLAVFGRPWVGLGLLLLSLWPLASMWDRILYPEHEARQYALQQGMERVLLRDVALRMRAGPPGKFLAPWWLTPALAYWSGHSGLTGSGRLNGPGVLDSARFYLSASPQQAAPLVERAEIRWIVADEPARVVEDSRQWFGGELPETPFAKVLMERPHSAAPWLKPVFANQFFKLFLVQPHNMVP